MSKDDIAINCVPKCYRPKCFECPFKDSCANAAYKYKPNILWLEVQEGKVKSPYFRVEE